MFIFIAGYKYELTKKNRDIRKYYRSKINNIVKPTFIISILWILGTIFLSVTKKIIYHQNINILFYIKVLFYRISKIFLGSNDIYQLWYIPMYILITFSYPTIEKYIKSKNKIILFFTLAIIQNIGVNYIDIIFNKLNFIYYFLFFELGIIFFKREQNIKGNKLILSISYSILLIICNIFLEGIFYKIFTNLIIYPIGVVVLYYIARYLQESKLLNIIGRYSFIVYVLHEPIILSGIGRIIKYLGIYIYWIWVPIISCLGLFSCIYLYKFTMKFRIGQYFWNNKKY